ncbi:polyphosphate kinase 2 [Rhizobium halophytocola]|uniref:ADP/GDP-polyphosphate phosphotransferase n=1 Tax=Rhizobium halophytocola TaxID=735519 RepID=A0ABS4E0N2_9HYPH|nr:polyphosphate kinase 2 [Rhizobium halophytocola]MBP1851488.1 polyphosphate kinase 2 [Rhizobium halophytocola]
MGNTTTDRSIELEIGSERHRFDIDDPDLPKWIEHHALSSDDYPYDKKLDRDDYEKQLEKLQIELVKVQFWLQKTGRRVMALFEGRDAAGKGGTIHAVRSYMNPRYARIVALTKPTETEAGQWYFQRYVPHFPSAGEFVMFDRSWYNRAGVEPVMGFCTPEQYEHFLLQVPNFERLIVEDGVIFFKFWLNLGQEMQLKRFHDRRHDPLKVWKLSPMDIAALSKWDDYTVKRDRMLNQTHTGSAPWTVVKSNDKRRARVNVIRHILQSIDYDEKDDKAIGKIDERILGHGSGFVA